MSKVAFLSVSCLVVACGGFIVRGATAGDAWRATADFLGAGGYGIFAMVVVVVVRGRKRQGLAEVAEHAVVEAGIVELKAERVLKVDAAAHGLGSVTAGEAGQELQHAHRRQLTSRTPQGSHGTRVPARLAPSVATVSQIPRFPTESS
jgi:hypothetical protein